MTFNNTEFQEWVRDLARLGEEVVVKGNRTSFPAFETAYANVEPAPVKLPFGVLAKAAFTRLSVSAQLEEVELPVYCKYQNHCLDDETFKNFSVPLHLD